MVVTVKLKNHQNYVVNKRYEGNVSCPEVNIQYKCSHPKEPTGMCAG